MAYNEPMLLARIVDRLKAPNHYMFIHIDKKSDIEEFKAYLPEDSHTVYLPTPPRVSPGGVIVKKCFGEVFPRL